jgi:hypothetical protein
MRTTTGPVDRLSSSTVVGLVVKQPVLTRQMEIESGKERFINCLQSWDLGTTCSIEVNQLSSRI